ncbi:MAG TPA: PEP-utilizing enzyme [Acidimicrobiales bacterium]|nr:PEP-utilizing enzyme [Acidimicrobiales bacterium]
MPPVFEAPGPGQWVLDTGHFPRPATSFTAELFPDPSRDGFADATAPYGLLLDYIEWGFVAGWGYLCPTPVPAVREAGVLTRERWNALVGSSPDLGARLAVSESVFERRAWRDDLALWDNELKPSLLSEHRRVQQVEPRRLDDDELLAHLEQCRVNLRRSISVHHRFNVTPVLPVGELLVRAREWTGASALEVLGLLRGAGPLAVGAGDELTRLADAVQQDAEARLLLEPSDDAQSRLASLCSRPGPVSEAAAAYVDLVAHWSAGGGFDVGEPSLVEMPSVLLETLRVAAGDRPHIDEGPDAEALAHELRAAVPPTDRAEFDDLLAESRLVHRLRDERALYCDVWANGLMRRALLAAGERLGETGLLDDPSHAVDATWAELRSLLADGGGPTAGELAARARYRDEADADEVPVLLGESTRSPVPLEWLSPGAARNERAFRVYLAAMAGTAEEPGPAAGSTVRGQGASGGTYEGAARVVHSAAGLAAIQEGDVLVTVATSPAFNVVLPLVGAIVTDRGGMLSHAAIVAREYGVPAVVGSGDATQRIPDGARLRVDGDAGEVTVVDGGAALS